MNKAQTFAACLTPTGSGAIATIAVRGRDALDVIATLWRSSPSALLARSAGDGPSLALRAGNAPFALGKFGDEAVDDVVLIVKQLEPIPCIEVHCHGGREVVRLLLETLQRHGVTLCSWHELERQTSDQPLRTEALLRLAETQTVRTAAILLDQVHGAFDRAVWEALYGLERGDLAHAGRLLEDMARHSSVGCHLTTPWRVVVAGAPNVGKSSLVNALAGYQRTIVSPVPGTTRDVVAVRIAIDGWPIELTDTAGLRIGAAALEERGIRLATAAVAAADLCLWLLDGADANASPVATGNNVPSNALPVINKTDLPSAWDWSQVMEATHVSALTGAGLDDLCRLIVRCLVPEPPPAGAAVPFTDALCDQISTAWRCWSEGRRDDVRGILKGFARGSV